MKPTVHRSSSRVPVCEWAVIVGVWMSSSGFCRADPSEPDRLDTFENAALYYWKAAAKIRPANSAADLEEVRFIEQELPDLPPQVFGYRPEAGRRLIGERGMLSELRYGAQRPVCRFVPPLGNDAPRDLSFRAVMRRVWRRGLAAAKALEFVGEDGPAVQVYLDLFRMLDHLDQDLDWATAYVCVQWQPEWIRAVTGYILRNPDESALQPLLDFLADLKSPRFPMRQFTEQEYQTYARWLFEDIAQIEPKLAVLYGDQSTRPALQRLADLNLDEKRAVVNQWAREYRREVEALAQLLDQPYAEVIGQVRDLDKRIAEIRRSPENPDQNHLLPLLMPPMERTLQQFVAAEAACTMVSMLGAGAVFRGLVGQWPETRMILESFAGRSFPPDPFSGEPFGYQIRKALPVIRMEAPGWLAEETDAVVELHLHRRFTEDEAKLQRAATRSRERQQVPGAGNP